MASGATHDKAGYLLTIPLAIASQSFMGSQIAAYVTGAYLAGICWLSPDLDIESKPWHRWGILKVLWVPYQKLIPHRGLSHWLVIGTLSRVLYLALPMYLIFPDIVLRSVQGYGQWVFIGLELSAIVHYFLDGILFKRMR
jgi:uncharacterized metal-binding protein